MDREEELSMAHLLMKQQLEPVEATVLLVVVVLVEKTLLDFDIFGYIDLILYQLDCNLEYK